MKINYTNRLQNINPYKTQMERTQKQAEQQTSKTRDRVDISSQAKQMQENPISAARKEKVEALRNQVQSGEYKVNPHAVAEKMLTYWKNVGSVNNNDE